MYVYVSCRVLCVCVEMVVRVYVESVCGVCAESVWDVRFVCCVLCCIVVCVCVCRYVLCWCWCWCAMRGVCVVCVVCVCVWYVVWCVRGLARGKPPACRLKTFLYVGSKRIRVFRQNARMLNTSPFDRPFLTLCIYSKLPIFFVPLPLVPRGDVGVVFTRDLVKTSASIFVPYDSMLRFSVRFSCCLNRWRIELLWFFKAFFGQSLAWCFSFPASSTMACARKKKTIWDG